MNKPVERVLCILILQYNSADLTLQLLYSLVKHELDNLDQYRVIVMDNASDDPLEDRITSDFDFVEFIQYNKNHGFAKAHNEIMKSIDNDWILLLNNDCILLNDAINKTLTLARKYGADFATCAVYNNDMTPQINFSTSPSPLKKILLNLSGFNRLFLEKMRLKAKTSSVGYINGAFLLLKKSSIPPPKLFDDRYFMYTEDMDLMIRLEKNHRKGQRIAEGKVIHLGGASAARKWGNREQSAIKLTQAKECLYRHYPKWLVDLHSYLRNAIL